MVVHPKGDQSEHGNIESDVPPGIGALDIVLVTESAQLGMLSKEGPDQKPE